jgi:hypothetical protein
MFSYLLVKISVETLEGNFEEKFPEIPPVFKYLKLQ